MKRYKHNLSYYNLATLDMGKLVPVGLTEALPGDTLQHHTNVVIRVSPLAAPVMHSVTARVHHFFVPHRLTWDGWEDFITGGPDGNNTDTVPTINVDANNWPNTRLFDYLGVPWPKINTSVSALPIRAYNAIFNEYYRDQDLVPEVSQDSPLIQNIAWEKDYLTTCRPWAQKGPEVTLPIAGEAPVKGIAVNQFDFSTPAPNLRETARGDVSYDASELSVRVEEDPDRTGYPGIYADLSQADAVGINDFRKAFALQRYQEARARYGSRYTEYLRFLGVRPRDERLQRPEFLGGGNAQIQFSEVLQTANDAGGDTRFGVADMYGHGIAAMRSNAYRRHIEEHGYIITLLSVRPKAVYANSIDRTWLRRDKHDFFQKELQHIGQQEVYNAEAKFGHTGGDTEYETWGYQDRYAEYRQGMNRVTGEYRDILNYWHMAREYDDDTMPVLNQSFVECDATKRIHNEQTQHALWCMCQHKLVARRLVDRSAKARIY